MFPMPACWGSFLTPTYALSPTYALLFKVEIAFLSGTR